MYCILTYLEGGNQKCIVFVFCAFKLQSGGKNMNTIAHMFFFFVSNKLSHLRVMTYTCLFSQISELYSQHYRNNRQIYLCWSEANTCIHNIQYSLKEFTVFLFIVPSVHRHVYLTSVAELWVNFELKSIICTFCTVLRWALLLRCKYF